MDVARPGMSYNEVLGLQLSCFQSTLLPYLKYYPSKGSEIHSTLEEFDQKVLLDYLLLIQMEEIHIIKYT